MAETGRSYLLVPAGGAGEGMGHLVRCLSLAEQLGPHVSFLTRHLDERPEAAGASGFRFRRRTEAGRCCRACPRGSAGT